MLGKDKSSITYLGVLKAPANIRLEQEAQPPFLLGGIGSGMIPLAREVGTSPVSSRSKAAFRCAVVFPITYCAGTSGWEGSQPRDSSLATWAADFVMF